MRTPSADRDAPSLAKSLLANSPMKRDWTRPIVACVLATSAACALNTVAGTDSGPSIVAAAAPVCYRLHVGPWSVPTNVQSAEQREVPPTPEVLVLDTAPAREMISSGPPFRAARGVSRDPAWKKYAEMHPPMWARSSDSLRVVVGELGWELIAREDHNSLTGRASVITDMAGLEFPSAPALGKRVPCAAE